jgi:arylsulfatase A-like enzyme
MLAGIAAFLVVQFVSAVWKLDNSSGTMTNKFSSLARGEYLGFLIGRNLLTLPAYILLGTAAALVVRPAFELPPLRKAGWRRPLPTAGAAFAICAAIHGFAGLRLLHTRPYFINEQEFGHWHYRIVDFIADLTGPGFLMAGFTVLPAIGLVAACVWHLRSFGRKSWIASGSAAAIIGTTALVARIDNHGNTPASPGSARPNIIVIGSDSLRGDKLGFAGHRPGRNDGPAAAGVSPTIDALAARSVSFERCFTSIASTLESGIQTMASVYPHTHGIRQMYPDWESVASATITIDPLASRFAAAGYDTAAIGDWCAGYYDIMPMGFEDVAVSSFDNFKIYMSQVVLMSHFIIPLYFDNPVGHSLFPEIRSFAQFVTPEVVTRRVEKRIASASRSQRPFFWHVFYSCNHLPYGSPEPYAGMFADPDYAGPHRSKVAFDIDRFIGGTDLESKWKALPEQDIRRIRALYDGCTRQFDDCVARILASLAANGLENNTIVVITADHGDDLYEPGVTLGHGLTLDGGMHSYQVPLVLHVPGVEPRRIGETVRLLDLAPTLAGLAGIEAAASWEGRDLSGWIRGNSLPQDLPVYAETGFPFIQFSVPGVERPALAPMDEMTFIDKSFNYQFVVKPEYRERIVQAKQRCLRTRDWKLVCTPAADGSRHFRLFHITCDPHCMNDLAKSKPEVLAAMRDALEAWIDQHIETPIGVIFPDGEPTMTE